MADGSGNPRRAGRAASSVPSETSVFGRSNSKPAFSSSTEGSGWSDPNFRNAHSASQERPASPYEYRSGDEDILNSKIGIYGWRKRCLYLFVVCLAVMAILNLALLVWITTLMDFSLDGMGKLRIYSDRVTVEGRSEFVSGLYARQITSEQNETLRLLSTHGINITAGNTYFLMGSSSIEAHTDRLEIRDTNGTAYFVATPTQLTTTVRNIILNSSRGATFQEFVQTGQIRGERSGSLHVTSPAGSISLLSGSELKLRASGAGVSMSSTSAISLTATVGNITIDTANLLLPRLPNVTSAGPPGNAANVYEVCVCANSGKLFLAAPDLAANTNHTSPCSAAAGVC